METQEKTSDYFAREIQRSWPYLRDASPDGAGFPSRAKRALLEGLLRLDRLPRDDPFWHNSNRRATFFKLQDFNRRLVEQDPCDEQALWCQIALAQKDSSGYLSAEAWGQLHRCGKLDVR